MPDAFRNSQANRPVVVKPPRAGTGADLNTMIQMAQGHKPTGKSIKYFKPSMIGLPDPEEGGFNPLKSIVDGLNGIFKSITGEIHTIEQGRQKVVSNIEQGRQKFVEDVDLNRKKTVGGIFAGGYEGGGVCGEDCDSLGNAVSIGGCKSRKALHGCGHPGTNEDIASHDQDCANFWGLGGLADGLCVGGKGATKAKDEWIIPLAVGGVLIIGLIVVMK